MPQQLTITINMRTDVPKAPGEIVSVRPTSEEGRYTQPFPANGPLAYVHIVDIPDRVNLDKLRNRLTSPDPTEMTTDPDGTLRHPTWRFEYRLPVASLPAARRQALRRDGQITVTWTQFRNFLRRRRDNAELPDGDVT